MTEASGYTPPKVWKWDSQSGGAFSKINRPIAGATHDKELPVGRHPLQLYSLGTPNGVKVTILLEELLARGESGAEYDAHLIRIGDGDQFGSGFVAINPNSKIPALVDRSMPRPTRVFESGAILLYLAEKTGRCLGQNRGERVEIQKWFIFHMNSALPAFRFLMRDPEGVRKDVARVCHVIDSHLSSHRFFADSYSIADMALYPRIATIEDALYDVRDHRHIARWLDDVGGREAVIRGMAQPSCPHLGP